MDVFIFFTKCEDGKEKVPGLAVKYGAGLTPALLIESNDAILDGDVAGVLVFDLEKSLVQRLQPMNNAHHIG
jgi:hypothetical protein